MLSKIKPAGGGDYTTLQAWEDAISGTTPVAAKCYSGGDMGNLALDASGPSQIKIYVAHGHQCDHRVRDNTGKAYCNSIYITRSNVHVRGIYVLNSVVISTNGPSNVENCIVEKCVADGEYAVFGVYNNGAFGTNCGDTEAEFRQCTCWTTATAFASGCSNYGDAPDTFQNTVLFTNCTAIVSGINVASGFGVFGVSSFAGDSLTNTVECRNCYAQIDTGACFEEINYGGPGTLTLDLGLVDCASTDATADDFPGPGLVDQDPADWFADETVSVEILNTAAGYAVDNNYGYHVGSDQELLSTVNPAGGGDYTTIQAWHDAGRVADHEVECFAGNMGNLIFGGLPRLLSTYLYANSSCIHAGVNGSTTGFPCFSGSSGGVFLYDPNVHIKNLVFTNSGSSQQLICDREITSPQADNYRIEGCLFVGSTTNTPYSIFVYNNQEGILTAELINNFVYQNSQSSFGQTCIRVLEDNADNTFGALHVDILNNSMTKGAGSTAQYGIAIQNSMTGSGEAYLHANIKNNLIVNLNPCLYQTIADDATINSANNATSDQTADDLGGSGYVNGISLTNNYNIVHANTDLKLATYSLVSDAGATLDDVTDDCFGTARPVGSAYSIGAHEIAFTAVPNPAAIKPAGGGDFTTVQAWEDVVSSGAPAIAECYSGGTLGSLSFNNTGPTFTIIRAAEGHAVNPLIYAGTTGVAYGSSFWSASGGAALLNSVRFEGILLERSTLSAINVSGAEFIDCQMYSDATGGGGYTMSFGWAGTHSGTISGCTHFFVATAGTTNTSRQMTVTLSGTVAATFNATVKNVTLIQRSDATKLALAGLAFNESNTNGSSVLNVTVNNVACFGQTNPFQNVAGTINITASNNASSNGTADSVLGGTGNLVNQTLADWFANTTTDVTLLADTSPGLGTGDGVNGDNIGADQVSVAPPPAGDSAFDPAALSRMGPHSLSLGLGL